MFTHSSKKDIHESDKNHLIDAYSAACDVAKDYNWYEVKCVKEGKIRTREDIHEEIYNEIKKHIWFKNETIRTVLGNVTDMIASAVTTTTSTYVKNLKAEGLFDADAQKEAFNKTYEAVKQQLTAESKEIIEQVYGDIEAYLTNKIEELVETLK